MGFEACGADPVEVPLAPIGAGPVTVIVRGPPGRPVRLRTGLAHGRAATDGPVVDAAVLGPDGRAVLRAPWPWPLVFEGEVLTPGVTVRVVGPAPPVPVRVLDAAGAPVAGARVRSEQADAVTDAEGRAGTGARPAGGDPPRRGGPRCRLGGGPSAPCADLAGTQAPGRWRFYPVEGGFERVPEVPVALVPVPDVDPADPRLGEVRWQPAGWPLAWTSDDGRFCAEGPAPGPGAWPTPVRACAPGGPVRVVDAAGEPAQVPVAVGEVRAVPDLVGGAWLPDGPVTSPAGARREGDRVIVPVAPPPAPRFGAAETRALLVGTWRDADGDVAFTVLASGAREREGRDPAALVRAWAGGAAWSDGAVLLLADADAAWLLGDAAAERVARRRVAR